MQRLIYAPVFQNVKIYTSTTNRAKLITKTKKFRNIPKQKLLLILMKFIYRCSGLPNLYQNLHGKGNYYNIRYF